MISQPTTLITRLIRFNIRDAMGESFGEVVVITKIIKS
jgi:hypothetical protein